MTEVIVKESLFTQTCFTLNLTLMKNFICLPMLAIVCMMASCEKNSVEATTNSTERKELLIEARNFAQKHDQLVNEMLTLDNALTMQRSPSAAPMDKQERLDHVLNIIYRVTGIKPIVAEYLPSKVSAAASGEDTDYYWVNLDVEEIALAPYAATDASLQYLGVVDDIVQNQETCLEEKLTLLQDVINEVAKDDKLPVAEMERVLTAIEVLKGSLALWSEYFDAESTPSLAPGRMQAPIRDWSFGKKLAFVAAADAVGGVLGFFLGGVIVINGIPVYLPSGPTGMVISAAALSYIAASMVGW
jgi:hypothetical protein